MAIADLINKILRRNTQETLVVVCATHPLSISGSQLDVVQRLMAGSGADYWVYIKPATFEAFFKRKDKARATALMEALRRPGFGLGMGMAEGELQCERLPSGKLARAPIGAAINIAAYAARSEATALGENLARA